MVDELILSGTGSTWICFALQEVFDYILIKKKKRMTFNVFLITFPDICQFVGCRRNLLKLWDIDTLSN